MLLTLNVGECAEHAARTVAGLLHVVALGTLVYLRVKLLLSAGVTVAAQVPRLTVARLSPLVPVLHVGTWRRPTKIIHLSEICT